MWLVIITKKVTSKELQELKKISPLSIFPKGIDFHSSTCGCDISDNPTKS